jgi:hypothetical protein
MKVFKHLLFVASTVLLSVSGHTAATPVASWTLVSPAKLCVTEGSLVPGSDARFTVDVPKMRAYLTAPSTQDIQASFTYFGPTKDEKPLASGEMRRQFGLKLHAKDACNLVYVMWRIAPASKLVVSVKSNPDQHTSADCGNRGYQNIKAAHTSPVPALEPGSSHTLRAETSGSHLNVFADDKLVWQGEIDAQAAGLAGPVGIRSDNAKLEIELRAGGWAHGAHPNFQIACRPTSGESE